MYRQLKTDTADEQLARLVKQGDERAFELVYERYHKLLYVLSYRYVMDRNKAEDIVQNVFVKLWEYRKCLDIGISLKNYLFTMAKNHVLNVIRNENSALAKRYELAQRTSEYADDLVEKLEKRERMSLFGEALDCLPPQKREVCRLKVYEGLSIKDIACRMNLSPNTVKTHYAEALKSIRRQLAEKLINVIAIILLSF